MQPNKRATYALRFLTVCVYYVLHLCVSDSLDKVCGERKYRWHTYEPVVCWKILQSICTCWHAWAERCSFSVLFRGRPVFSTRAKPSLLAMALTQFCYPKRVSTWLSYIYSCCSQEPIWRRESLRTLRDTQCWLLMTQDYIQAQRYITFEACPVTTKKVFLFWARKFSEIVKRAFGAKVVAEMAGASHYAV